MAMHQRQLFEPEQFPPNVRAKWAGELLREGFVPFPKMLLRILYRIFADSEEVDQLAAILAVVDYRRPNLLRSPSVDFLAFTAGIPIKRFNEVLSDLKKKRWIKIDFEPVDHTVDISTEGFEATVLKAVREEDDFQGI
jgi:hypothetical protein